MQLVDDYSHSTVIHSQDWIFNALWSSCAGTNSKRCTVDIPTTILFQQGKPNKCLTTDPTTGNVIRQHVGITMTAADRGLLSRETNKYIQVCKDLFQYHLNDQSHSNPNQPFCSCVYLDGKRETISIHSFDVLMRNTSWRLTVLLIQEIVEAKSYHKGQHSRYTLVKSMIDQSSVTHNADTLAKTIALAAECAYLTPSHSNDPSAIANTNTGKRSMTASSTQNDSDDNNKRAKTSDTHRKDKLNTGSGVGGAQLKTLRIREMTVTFALVDDGRLVFISTDRVVVDIDSNNPTQLTATKMELQLSEEHNSREYSSAMSVLEEFKDILVHGEKRGLPVEESFKHFDDEELGYVSVHALQRGLQSLGIDVMYSVAVKVMEMVAGDGASICMLRDFEILVGKNVDEEDTNNFLISAHGSVDAKTSTGHTATSRPLSGVKPKPQQPRSAGTSDGSKVAGRNNSSASSGKTLKHALGLSLQNSNKIDIDGNDYIVTNSGRVELVTDDLKQVYKDQIIGPAMKHQHERLSKTLPQQQSYQVIGANVTKSGKNKIHELADWTRPRSRATLKELKSTHKKWKENKNFSNDVPTANNNNNDDNEYVNSDTNHATTTSIELQGIGLTEEHLNEALADELCHVSRGLVMSYRFLRGPTSMEIFQQEKSNRYNYLLANPSQDDDSVTQKSISKKSVKINDPNAKSSIGKLEKESSIKLPIKKNLFITFIVVPDLFMTLEVLQTALSPLLSRHPTANLLLVGCIGLPNTVWPKEQVLDTDLQVTCLKTLLLHLKSEQEFPSDSTASNDKSTTVAATIVSSIDETNHQCNLHKFIFVGYGTGASVISRFLSRELNNSGNSMMVDETNDEYKYENSLFDWLIPHIESVCLINCVYTYIGQFLRICSDLHEQMLIADSSLMNDIVNALHFSNTYIDMLSTQTITTDQQSNNKTTALAMTNQNNKTSGQDTALGIFWGLRRGLTSHYSNLALSGVEYTGILQQLEGIIRPGSGDSGRGSRDEDEQQHYHTDLTFLQYSGSGSGNTSTPSHDSVTVTASSDNNAVGEVPDKESSDVITNNNNNNSKGNEEVLKVKNVSIGLGDVPLVLIQSTEDSFVNPRNVEYFKDVNNLPSHRHLAADFSECMKQGSVHISWLKSGHEVLQERGHYVLGMLSTMVQMTYVKYMPPTKDKDSSYSASVESESADKAEMSSMRRRKVRHSSEYDDEHEEEEELFDVLAYGADIRGRKYGKYYNPDDIIVDDQDSVASPEQDEPPTPPPELEEEPLQVAVIEPEEIVKPPRKRMFMKKEAIQGLSEDEILARQLQYEQELDRYKFIDEKSKEKKREAIERKKMSNEDNISYFADEYQRSEALAYHNAFITKQRLHELNRLRVEEIKLKNIEKIARARAMRAELRRQQVDEMLRRLEIHENHILGTDMGVQHVFVSDYSSSSRMNSNYKRNNASGGNTAAKVKLQVTDDAKLAQNIPTIVILSQKLLDDYLNVRHQYIEVLKRKTLVEDKLFSLKKYNDNAMEEIRRLKRSVKLLQVNPGLVAGRRVLYNNDISDLKESIAQKEDYRSEMVSLMNSREKQFIEANRSLSKCKSRLKILDKLVAQRIQDLEHLEAEINLKLKLYKNKIESINHDKSVIALKYRKSNEHLIELERELHRVESNSATRSGDTVDTDIWFRGVIKRMKKSDLIKHLQKDIRDGRQVLEELSVSMLPVNERLLLAMDDFSLAKRNSDKINVFLKLFKYFYTDYDISSAVDISKVLLTAQKQELTREEKKENFLTSKFSLQKGKSKSNFSKVNNSLKLLTGGEVATDANAYDEMYMEASEMTLLDQVRNKESEARTRDERDFICLDMMMYPELYEHLSDLEREEIRFDNKNVTGITKDDINKILKLPHQVNLAMPFLKNNIEVNCHRLVLTYYQNKGETFYQQMDFISGSSEITAVNQKNKNNDEDDDEDDIDLKAFTSTAAVNDKLNKSAIKETQTIEEVLKLIKTSGLSKKQMVEAEIVHDILVKQMLTDHIRTKLVNQIQQTTNLMASASNTSFDDDHTITTISSATLQSSTINNNTVRSRSNSVSGIRAQPRLTLAQVEEIKSNFLTQEELDWLQLDRILNTQYYNNTGEVTDSMVQDQHKLNWDSVTHMLDKQDIGKDEDQEDFEDIVQYDNKISGGQYYNDTHSHNQQTTNAWIPYADTHDPEDAKKVWRCPYTSREELLSVYRKKNNTKEYISKLRSSMYIKKTETSIDDSLSLSSAVASSYSSKTMLTAGSNSATSQLGDTLAFSNDEVRIKYLMDKYYVSEEESLLGVERLKAMKYMTGRLHKIFTKIDREEDVVYHLTMERLLHTKDAENRDIDIESELEFRNKVKNKQALKHHVAEDLRIRNQIPVVEVIPKKQPPKRDSFYYAEYKDDSDNDDNDDDNPLTLEKNRVWGAFTSVHPASTGSRSQTTRFFVSAFDPHMHHPASYAYSTRSVQQINNTYKPPTTNKTNDFIANPGKKKLTRTLLQSLQTLTANPGEFLSQVQSSDESAVTTTTTALSDALTITQTNEQNKTHQPVISRWFIAKSIQQLARTPSKELVDKMVILQQKEPTVMLYSEKNSLLARQSKAHKFEIPDNPDMRILDISVSVVYMGTFNTSGDYKVGRLGAGLFQLPNPADKKSSLVPVPIGYAPYAHQTPNTMQQMGKVSIFHTPVVRPLRPGQYQVVIGCASTTKYSIEVKCHYAQAVMPIIAKLLVQARTKQARLPVCLKEMQSLTESLRLAERKLELCEEMVIEAETESTRCQVEMREILHELRIDDEQMLMTEADRTMLKEDLYICESDFAIWASVYESRCKERDDITDGIKMMKDLQVIRGKEKDELMMELDSYRRDLPACVGLLKNFSEASNVAASLNATIENSFSILSSSDTALAIAQTAGVGNRSWVSDTPAQVIRNKLKAEKMKKLSLEEQQWVVLDRSLNPSMYEWLVELEAKEAEERALRLQKLGGRYNKSVKQPAVIEQHLHPSLEHFKLPKSDIEKILSTPFSVLSRRELVIRKLLSKYHDNTEMMKKKAAEMLRGFDPLLSERVRAKDPQSFTREEWEFASVDNRMYPLIWKYYTHDPALNFVNRRKEEDEPANLTANQLDKKSMFSRMGKSSAVDKDQDATQKSALANLSNILGDKTLENKSTDDVDFSSFMKTFHRKAAENDPLHTKPWQCPFSRDQVLEIWKSNVNSLRGEDELLTYRLLMKYHGPYTEDAGNVIKKYEALEIAKKNEKLNLPPEYQPTSMKTNLDDLNRKSSIVVAAMSAKSSATAVGMTTSTTALTTTTVTNTNTSATTQNTSGHAKGKTTVTSTDGSTPHVDDTKFRPIQWDRTGKTVTTDVDLRCRQLQREIDRVGDAVTPLIDSDVLTGTSQRVLKTNLYEALNDELDYILMEQIRERERSRSKRLFESFDNDAQDDQDSANDKNSDNSDGDDSADGLSIDDDSSSNSDNDNQSIDGDGKKISKPKETMHQALLKRVTKRAARRNRRRQRLKKGSTEDEILKAKKMIKTNNKSGQALAEAILQNQLGVGGCLACRATTCKWVQTVQVDFYKARRQEVSLELERVRLDRESDLFESEMSRSAVAGGNKIFRRQDLLDELNYELVLVGRHIELADIDKELHDVYATRKEYVEVKHLHGYAMTMWTNAARIALGARQKHLIGQIVASQVIDEILDWMHEGWYFGETQVDTTIRGYVPSLDKNNVILTQEDAVRHMPQAIEKIKARNAAKKKGIILDETKQGDHHTKALPIEMRAQHAITQKKVAREKNKHEHLLNETENTIRFGLFMLTYMYFRAMSYLAREKKSYGDTAVKAEKLFHYTGNNATEGNSGSNGGGDNGGKKKNKNLLEQGIGTETAERKKMIQQEKNIEFREKRIDAAMEKAEIGQQRKREREDKQRREALTKLQVVIKRQNLEKRAIATIQRVYRGFIGRKVARRWALKRAELAAMNALLNATAIFLQRVWRGYLGRKQAKNLREEMAKFIALMRLEEAQADEDLYWETHAMERYKKNRKEWIDRKIWRKAPETNQLGVLTEALRDHHQKKERDEDMEEQELEQMLINSNLTEERIGGKALKKI